ncbi:MAG TPA: carboxypeptidase-like regulatory domain-containing protein [Ohtaekwangia sp.]|nr:carboxypeptidase-like regulatory domain-containing protein [Ohtaekwangia sp.]
MNRNLITALFLLLAESMYAQEVFTGMVGDSATFAPLAYVNIKVKNSGIGTITDQKGNFRIRATRKDTLIFSFVGYYPVEFALYDWQPSMVLLAEETTMLDDITIRESRMENPYAGMFEEENEALRKANKALPFYFSRSKKQKVKLNRLANENERVETYVNAVVKNESIRKNLMKKYDLSEAEYYDLLGDFNAKHYTFMYYITAGELIALLNNYFERHAGEK